MNSSMESMSSNREAVPTSQFGIDTPDLEKLLTGAEITLLGRGSVSVEDGEKISLGCNYKVYLAEVVRVNHHDMPGKADVTVRLLENSPVADYSKKAE
jgi:hypothetical protein